MGEEEANYILVQQAIERCEVEEEILEEIQLEAELDKASDSRARDTTQKKGSLSSAVSPKVKRPYLIHYLFQLLLSFWLNSLLRSYYLHKGQVAFSRCISDKHL